MKKPNIGHHRASHFSLCSPGCNLSGQRVRLPIPLAYSLGNEDHRSRNAESIPCLKVSREDHTHLAAMPYRVLQPCFTTFQVQRSLRRADLVPCRTASNGTASTCNSTHEPLLHLRQHHPAAARLGHPHAGLGVRLIWQ